MEHLIGQCLNVCLHYAVMQTHLLKLWLTSTLSHRSISQLTSSPTISIHPENLPGGSTP